MSEHPKISPGDWITVGNTDCVVTIVKQNVIHGYWSAVCVVVFNETNPTTHDVDWDGEKWFFPERPDYGGYANVTDQYVRQLKRGRYA